MNGFEVERTGLSILVVEDDADAADSYELFLRLAGYQVRTALDGPSALRVAAEAQPDVALIDIGLPGMDGYAVARELRRQSGPKRPFLIAVTGFGAPEERLQALAVGIDLHIAKPADPENLLGVLNRFERLVSHLVERSVDGRKAAGRE